MSSLRGFHRQMVECEIYRNQALIGTYKGLINDTPKFNFISFEIGPDIQPNDDIYCPIKNKHYIVTNVDITIFCGHQDRIDAYFENNYQSSTTSNVFNTYNPTSTIIGTQQNATINVGTSIEELKQMIEQLGGTDKIKLYELSNTLETELNNGSLSKKSFQKFSDLIAKHSWVPLTISQIVSTWLLK